MRLDRRLVADGAFESRAKARAAIDAGAVRVDGAVARKAGALVAPAHVVAVDPGAPSGVSRGGVKLAAALDRFAVDPAGRVALDLGASTGGFTEVLLQRGAARVFAVDVGRGQLHAALAADPRVVNLEKTHAKDLSPALINPAPSLIVCDVSFISLKKAAPPALALAAPGARLVALVKPQFEVGPARIGKGGRVKEGRDNAEGVAEDMAAWLAAEPGWRADGWIESPIRGGDGNREFLLAGTHLAETHLAETHDAP
ncbi:MAG: TlyA family RNA methyltransferase [Pseudomonadota bacterium]